MADRPDSEGFILLRDRHGFAWAAYHPQTRTLRRTKRQPRSGCPDCEQVADISIDKLIAGDAQPVATFTRPRRLID